jgi:hypothetical protein
MKKVKEAWEYAPKNIPDVCHQWASRRKESASCGNVDFHGGTIYSYGWWPMATFMKAVDGADYVIMATYPYSNETSNHMGHVRRAIAREIPTFYSNRTDGYSLYRHTPRLTVEAVMESIVESMGQIYENAFVKNSYHRGWRADSADTRIGSSTRLREQAAQLCKLSGMPWDQDVDKYTFTPPEIEIMQKYDAERKLACAERSINAEIRHKKIEQALRDAINEFCPDSFTAACTWIKNGGSSNAKYWHEQKVEIPHSHEYYKLTRKDNIGVPAMDTAMRIDGDEVVTSMSARVPVKAAMMLWERIKANRDVVGFHVGLYEVKAFNGELVIGCHHISRRVIDFFVEHYNWE